MPACRVCGKVQATAEIRRAPLGPLCKDKLACRRRQREQREQEKRAA
jgi:hypothetical protein